MPLYRKRRRIVRTDNYFCTTDSILYDMVADVAMRSISAMRKICLSCRWVRWRGGCKRSCWSVVLHCIHWFHNRLTVALQYPTGLSIYRKKNPQSLCISILQRSCALKWFSCFSTMHSEAAHAKNRKKDQFAFFKTVIYPAFIHIL